jgi:hypothetical protein
MGSINIQDTLYPRVDFFSYVNKMLSSKVTNQPKKKHLLLKNSPQNGIHVDLFLSRYKIRMAPHHKIVFCDPKTFLLKGINSSNTSFFFFHPQIVMLALIHSVQSLYKKKNYLVFTTIYFKHRNVTLPVDFISWWMLLFALILTRNSKRVIMVSFPVLF